MSFTFIDLFAGCGGFSLGFIAAGGKCLAALEYDVHTANAYWQNLCLKGWSHLWMDKDATTYKKASKVFGTGHTFNELFDIPSNQWLNDDSKSPCMNLFYYDITKLSPEDFCRLGGFSPGDVDVIIGGPPCQGFSTSNTNRSMHDNRNTLVFRYLYYASIIQPQIFIIENVPGMLTLGKKSHEKEGPFPKWIREAAAELGYIVDYGIHNACDYGVPQNRRRVIFAGVRKDLYNQGLRYHGPEATHIWDYHDGIPPAELFDQGQPRVNILEAIGDLNDITLGALQEQYHKNYKLGDTCRLSSDTSDAIEFECKYFKPDSLTGIYVPAGRKNKKFFDDPDTMKDYKICDCGAYNLKVRQHCHRCSKRFTSLLLPDDMLYK